MILLSFLGVAITLGGIMLGVWLLEDRRRATKRRAAELRRKQAAQMELDRFVPGIDVFGMRNNRTGEAFRLQDYAALRHQERMKR